MKRAPQILGARASTRKIEPLSRPTSVFNMPAPAGYMSFFAMTNMLV
jgi:hypothetical protein